MTDNVKHPSHYTYGKIECIDFILDKELDFSLGNAVKYIVRAGRKNPEKRNGGFYYNMYCPDCRKDYEAFMDGAAIVRDGDNDV